MNSAGKLEALLFGDILGIKIEALEFLKNLTASERSSAEGLTLHFPRPADRRPKPRLIVGQSLYNTVCVRIAAIAHMY